MNVALYIRVSRVGGRAGESFISPAVQRERAEAAAKAGGHDIVKVFEDLDQPGSKAGRPGFQAALKLVEQGAIDGIVVAKLDRFARSVADAATALRRINDAGGALISAGESLDTSTPFGRFAMHMMLAIAELELDRIRENWDAARAQAVARGIHVASRAPTGYDRDEAKRLVPNGDAAAIGAAFRAKAKGGSWGEVGELLEAAGVVTPYGGANWTPKSLRHVLSNRVYLGEARSGVHVLAGAHESLIDSATWQLAQQKRGTRTPTRGGALLSGILRCAGCRYALKADFMRDRSGAKVRIYSCRGKRSSGTCRSRSAVLGSVVEPWVVERFFDRIGDIKLEAVELTEAIEEAERELAAAEAALEVYLTADIGELVTPAQFREGVESRRVVVDAAEAKRASVLASTEAADLPPVASLRAMWPTLDVAHQRSLLASGIDAIFLRSVGQANTPIADRALILWLGDAPTDLPGMGRRVAAIRPFDWPEPGDLPAPE